MLGNLSKIMQLLKRQSQMQRLCPSYDTVIQCSQNTVKYSNSKGSMTQATLVFSSLKVSFNLFTFFTGIITIFICPSSSILLIRRQKDSSLKTHKLPLQNAEKKKCEVEKSKLWGKSPWICINLRGDTLHSEVRSGLNNLNFQIEFEILLTRRNTWITKY